MTGSGATLVGALTLDHHLSSGVIRPGGGALNMAYHWSRIGRRHRLVGRVGAADGEVLHGFCARHGIALTPDAELDGSSSAIDLELGPDGEIWMDNFREGVTAGFRLTDREVGWLGSGSPAHLVLVDVVDAELHRVAPALPGARLTGDFLSFRHMTVERFVATAKYLDVAFVGWPGELTDTIVDQLQDAADTVGTLLVITAGSTGILVADGRTGARHRFPVEALTVAGSTVGCGDAFAAAFLDSWFHRGDLAAAVDAGRRLGAEATGWPAALPETAYG